MAVSLKKLIVAATALLVCSAQASCQSVDATSVQRDFNVIPIYYNALGRDWVDGSVGCADCNYNDKAKARDGSEAAFSVELRPFGRVVLQHVPFFSGQAVLDVIVKGESVTKGTLFLENSENLTRSEAVVLSELRDEFRVVSGPDADGWLHAQIFLDSLTRGITRRTGLPNVWDRIVLVDHSGMGISTRFDRIFLVETPDRQPQSAAVATIAARAVVAYIGSASSGLEPVSPDGVPPIANQFVASTTALADGDANRWILVLKPGLKYGQIFDICDEGSSAGVYAASAAPRFELTCRTELLGTEDTPRAQDADAEIDDLSRLVSVRLAPGQSIEELAVALAGRVELIDRDLAFTIQGFETPGGASFDVAPPRAAGAAASWGLDRVDQQSLPLDGAYDPDVLGAGAHVFVADTGVRTDHVEFSGRVSDSYSAVSGSPFAGGTAGPRNATAAEPAWWDRQGHGTHCAGTAVGATYGVAPRATLHAVKVLGDSGSGTTSDIVAGLNWVLNYARARSLVGRSVVSMSLGGGASPALDRAVQDLVAAGVTTVVAAGNSNADACGVSPARASGVVTVASTDRNDRKSSFSNWGRCVEIWAPGSAIRSAHIASRTAARDLSGTSMATPHVAGAAALYLATRPNTPPLSVLQALQIGAVERAFDPRTIELLLNVEDIAPPSTPKPSPAPTSAPTQAPRPTPPPPTPPVSEPTPRPPTRPSPGIPGWT
ncbi:unnamed protein product [Pedinophyceae sp. YPF-701]|nr:unnamed protein product [Pedinophyceae sp. YPF-701]